MKKVKGNAVIEAIWDMEIPEDALLRDTEELRKVARKTVIEALTVEAMATEVIVKSLEMDITDEG